VCSFSAGYYCPPDDIVQGQDLGTCLGDMFSISWLEDAYARADSKSRKYESLEDQFIAVKNRTTMSEVCQYGALSWTNFTDIFVFEGVLEPSATPKARPSSATDGALRKGRNLAAAAAAEVTSSSTSPSSSSSYTAWNSREATIRSIVHRLNKAKATLGDYHERTLMLQAKLDSEVARNSILKRASDLIAVEEFEQQTRDASDAGGSLPSLASVLPAASWAEMAPSAPLATLLNTPLRITRWDCYRNGIITLERVCRAAGTSEDDEGTETVTDWGMQYLKIVGHLCEKEDYATSPVGSEQVERVIERACEMAVAGVVM
jgi:Peptidase C13 family